jgi:hypothetical protein
MFTEFAAGTVRKPDRNPGGSNIMWTHEVAPERLAELFHHYQQALAPEKPSTATEQGTTWKEIAPQKKSRLVAAARLALLELESMHDAVVAREYFAQPGEAEWGC